MRRNVIWVMLAFGLAALAAPAEAGDCWATLEWSGENEGDGFGHGVSCAGDVDRDGMDDYFVGALGYDDTTGRAYLFSGTDGTLLHTFIAESAGDWVGRGETFAAADLNQDGFRDLLIGAPLHDETPGTGANEGRVYIFYGKTDPLPDLVPLGSADVILDGSFRFAGFGIAVQIMGDLDSDGFPDFAVGAFGYLGPFPGRVYVYSGQTLDTLFSVAGDGNPPQACFGLVGKPGDVNGDGILDLIVGEPDYLESGGSVYAFSGADGSRLFKIVSDNIVGGHTGHWPSADGDVNADGYDDMLIPAETAGEDNAGAVFVYLGGPGPYPVVDSAQNSYYWFIGTSTNSNLSWSTYLGDINLDGYDDFACAEWQLDRARTGAGKVCVHSGVDGSVLQAFYGEQAGDCLGTSVCRVGDRDGDGICELLVGAWQRGHTDTAGPGKAYLFEIGDIDADNVLATCDNCMTDANPGQEDFDGDAYGDVCDLCPRYLTPGGVAFMTGDVNVSSDLTSADIIYLVNCVFKAGPDPMPILEAGDCNCDGVVTSADIICMVNYTFKNGPPPCDACALPPLVAHSATGMSAVLSSTGDILRLEPAATETGEYRVGVRALHNRDLAALDIPIRFGAPGDAITLESVEWSDAVAGWDLTHAQIDNQNKTVILGLISELISVRADAELKVSASGGTKIAELVFRVSEGYEPAFTTFTTDRPGHELTFLYNDRVDGQLTVQTITPEFEVDMSFKSPVLPNAYALSENFPNPFNPSTSFTLSLPEASDYQIRIFNVAGQLVKTFEGHAEAGVHTITWDGLNEQGSQVASGVYFMKAQANTFEATRKMLMIK